MGGFKGIAGALSLLVSRVNGNSLPGVMLLDDGVLYHISVIRAGGWHFCLSQSPMDSYSRVGSEAVCGMSGGVGCREG